MLRTSNRTVPASQTVALVSLRALRSYTVSTGGNCQPGSQNVLRRVHVPIVGRPAGQAHPLPYVQRHRVGNVPALGAPLARWEPAINLNQPSPIPLALVPKLSSELTPSSVTNGPSKRVICHHASHVQVFHHNRLVFTDELYAQLVKEVLPDVCDLLVDLSHADTGLRPILRSFLLTGESLLRPLQLRRLALQWSRRLVLRSTGRGRKVEQPQVDPDSSIGLRHRSQRFVNAERHIVAARWRTAHYHGAWLSRESTRPLDPQCADLGERERSAIPLESRASELRRLATALLLERRVGCSLLPEIDESSLKIAKRLLRRDRTDFIQPHRLWLFLEFGQFGGSAGVVNTILLFVPRLGTEIERPVVDEAARPEGTSQSDGLLGRRVEAVLEASNHYLHGSILACKLQERNAIPPPPEGSGILAKNL